MIKDQLQLIRQRLLDAFLFGFLIIIPFAIFASLSRIFETGWLWIYLFHIILLLYSISLYVFRSKATVQLKAHSIALTFVLVSFTGTIKFGIVSGYYMCSLSVLISTLIFGKRIGAIYIVVSISGLSVIAYLHYNKIIQASVDYNVYGNNVTTWITLLIGTLLVQVIIIKGIGMFYDLFTENINFLTKKTIEQEIGQRELRKSEKELEEHRNRLEELVTIRTRDLEETILRLKETQSQLIQSEKLASIGVLTAGIAHEINNPINYINSSIIALDLMIQELIDIIRVYETVTTENINEKSKLIKETLNLNETMEGVHLLSNNIKIGAKKTANIVRSLKIFSRADSDEFELADIPENLDSTLILLHNQYKDKVEIIKKYESLPQLKCIPGKLNQVFMNLLSNAIQSIEEKGTITITMSLLTSDRNELNQECILISIKDTGIGIPSGIQNKVFEPFFTTKEIGKGTGLGLSISYGIIEEHKGKIEFTSEPNKGTEFRIYLPI